MRRFRLRRIVPTLVVAVASFGVIAVLHSQSGTGSAHAAEIASQTYSVLARPADPNDVRFAQSSAALREMAARSPQLGLEPSGARIVQSDNSQTVAVVPATTTPCLVSEGGDAHFSVSCGTPNQPTTAMVTYGSAMGVVPDSVDEVSFKMTDGTVVRGAVTNNMWSAPAEAASANIVMAGHTTVVDLMPRSRLPKGATVQPDGTVSIGDADPGG